MEYRLSLARRACERTVFPGYQPGVNTPGSLNCRTTHQNAVRGKRGLGVLFFGCIKSGQSFPKDLAVRISDSDGTDPDRRSPTSKPYGAFREALIAKIINQGVVDVATKMNVPYVDQNPILLLFCHGPSAFVGDPVLLAIDEALHRQLPVLPAREIEQYVALQISRPRQRRNPDRAVRLDDVEGVVVIRPTRVAEHHQTVAGAAVRLAEFIFFDLPGAGPDLGFPIRLNISIAAGCFCGRQPLLPAPLLWQIQCDNRFQAHDHGLTFAGVKLNLLAEGLEAVFFHLKPVLLAGIDADLESLPVGRLDRNRAAV